MSADREEYVRRFFAPPKRQPSRIAVTDPRIARALRRAFRVLDPSEKPGLSDRNEAIEYRYKPRILH